MHTGRILTARSGALPIRSRKEGGPLMAAGTAKWFNDVGGYGFVAPDEGGQVLYVRQVSGRVARCRNPGKALGVRSAAARDRRNTRCATLPAAGRRSHERELR